MEVYECQEHSTKTVGFVWWFLQNKVGLAVCFGWVFKSAYLEERLGDGFAQRCAFYLEVSSVRIGLSLTFGEQSISSILCVSCNFKLDLSYCIVFWGDHRRSWNKAGQNQVCQGFELCSEVNKEPVELGSVSKMCSSWLLFWGTWPRTGATPVIFVVVPFTSLWMDR